MTQHVPDTAMEPASVESMELGNLLFGSSRGEFAIPRGEWEAAFCSFLERCGFDSYGYPSSGDKPFFENDVFAIRPYDWSGDDTAAAQPNVLYKPEGVEIKWYKYPLRDAYCSAHMDFEQFKAMLSACEASMAAANE